MSKTEVKKYEDLCSPATVRDPKTGKLKHGDTVIPEFKLEPAAEPAETTGKE